MHTHTHTHTLVTCVCITCLLQVRTAFLETLNCVCCAVPVFDSVTIDEIKWVIKYTQPVHPKTAELFCGAMWNLAVCFEPSGCDKIASAGGIPVIVQLLACFPDEEQVVYLACSAMLCIALLSMVQQQ